MRTRRKNYLIENEVKPEYPRGPPVFRTDFLNVTIEYEDKVGRKHLFKNRNVQYDNDNNILLAPLLENIKEEGFNMANHIVSYYSHTEKVLVFVGKDPVKPDSSIMPSELDPSTPLLISLKPLPTNPSKIPIKNNPEAIERFDSK